jgi:hypothetical protein
MKLYNFKEAVGGKCINVLFKLIHKYIIIVFIGYTNDDVVYKKTIKTHKG